MNINFYKFGLLFTVIVFMCQQTWSQDYLKTPQQAQAELKAEMDILFQHMDKSKITTGLLSDYALEWVDMAAYDGIPSDTNYVDIAAWNSLYFSIYHAKINNNISLATLETVENAINNAAPVNNAVPLAIMHYRYDKLNENAYINGWLTYSGGQLREVSGKPSPYVQKDLFAVAPKQLIFTANTVSFVFKSDLFFRNNAKSINKLEINFNNEGGYKTVAWNTALSHSFSSGGVKNIYFKITYTDGSSYISKTNIYVDASGSLLKSTQSSLINYTYTIGAVAGLHYGGKVEIHYAPGNTSLKKPLIIAGPFDIHHLFPASPKYNLDYVLGQQNPQIQAIRTMMDLLQYDIVYLNYDDGVDDIFRNAELFRKVIKYVNQNKDKTLNNPNIVMGISMGGLVARHALRTMEIAGEDHDTWKFISMDSPHKGANLPLGLQAMLRHAESLKSYLNVEVLNQLYKVLDSKAAKQMLIYYCDKNVVINNDEHNNFQTKYDAAGFPLKCQSIAVSNGSNKGYTKYQPYTLLFNYDERYSWSDLLNVAGNNIFAGFAVGYIGIIDGMINLITFGSTSFKTEFSIHALPNQQGSTIYDGHIYLKKTVLFFIPYTINITHKTLKSQATMLPLDGAEGSFVGIGDANINDERIKNLMKRFEKKEFTFIPTVSSLALSNWKDLLNQNISSRNLYAEGLTEFESYICAPDTSFKHPDFAYAATFLAPHLAAHPVYFETQNSTFCLAETYQLKNPKNETITWSVSNNNFSLTNKTNTSVTVSSTLSDITGILTASHQVTSSVLPAPVLMQVKKRILSVPRISGPNMVCCNGNEFTLNCPPSGTIQWEVSGPFHTSTSPFLKTAKGNPVKICRHANEGGSSGTLIAKVGLQEIARKTITPCATAVNFENKSVTTDTTIEGATINVKNVTLGAKLIIKTGYYTSINIQNVTGAGNNNGKIILDVYGSLYNIDIQGLNGSGVLEIEVVNGNEITLRNSFIDARLTIKKGEIYIKENVSVSSTGKLILDSPWQIYIDDNTFNLHDGSEFIINN